MHVRCDHVHLRSRDAIAAAAFYTDLFGATETGREGTDPVTRVTMDLGGLTVFIEQAPASLPPPAIPPHLAIEHIGLRVDDLDAAVAELARRGIPLVSGITVIRPGLRIAFLDGPDHARIELLQRG